MTPFTRLFAALGPAIGVTAAIWAGVAWAAPFPVPFLLLFSTIIFAGYLGGNPAGWISALLACVTAIVMYRLGIGPQPFVGSLTTLIIGSAAIMLSGFLLGRLRDRHDAARIDLHNAQAQLEERLAEQRKAHARSLQSLKLSEDRLETAASLAGLGYFVFNVDRGIVEVCSEGHGAIFGMTAEQFVAHVSGLSGEMTMIHPEDREIVRRAYDRLREGRRIEMDYRFRRPDGSTGFIREYVSPEFDAEGRVVRGIGSSLDMTAERQTEERLRQSEKLRAVGQLTAGVAHDFNNLLAVVMGNADILTAEGATPQQRVLIEEILRAAERGSSLTRSLLSFAQKSHLSPEIVDPNAVLAESAAMCQRILPPSIALETETSPGIGEIELDRGLLENALLNLVLNARDAMAEGGRITLSTRMTEIAPDDTLARQLGLKAGRYAMLSVSDTGHGIAQDELRRVIEPFFTTKNRAEGSGLGLSMVQGFVRQSRGAMRITSEPENGTTVELYFPARLDAARPATRGRIASAPGTHRDGLRVLLVEDDEAVRKVILAQLRTMGVDADAAADGPSALRVLTRPGQYDIALLDNLMPGGMTGLDLARALRRIDPSLGIVLQSGDLSALADITDEASIDLWLDKPVSMPDLAQAIDTLSKPVRTANSA